MKLSGCASCLDGQKSNSNVVIHIIWTLWSVFTMKCFWLVVRLSVSIYYINFFVLIETHPIIKSQRTATEFAYVTLVNAYSGHKYNNLQDLKATDPKEQINLNQYSFLDMKNNNKWIMPQIALNQEGEKKARKISTMPATFPTSAQLDNHNVKEVWIFYQRLATHLDIWETDWKAFRPCSMPQMNQF